jgi:hypothetical protein
MEDKVYLFRCLKCNKIDRLTEDDLKRYVYPRDGEYHCPWGCKTQTVFVFTGTYDESDAVIDKFTEKYLTKTL